MFENKFISSKIYEKSIDEKIVVSERNNKKYQLDYKTDFILESLKKTSSFSNNAYYIQSTINQNIQKIAEKSLLDNLLLYEKKYKEWNGSYKNLNDIKKSDYGNNWGIGKVLKLNNDSVEVELIENGQKIILKNEFNKFGLKKQLPTDFLAISEYVYITKINNNYILGQKLEINGSVLVMDPYNGNILAMVGGTSYDESKFNRSYQAFRQPFIKPFLYAHAIENGIFYQFKYFRFQYNLRTRPNLPT